MTQPKNSEFFFKGKMYSCPESVYYPSEDSYFLAENIKIKKGSFVIDVGCGAGIQSLNAFSKGASKVLSIDINPDAIKAVKENCIKAGFKEIASIQSNLFSKCNEKADVIIFNPPYVVSDEIKYEALDGGKNGREILDEFIEQFPAHLAEKGTCFFLQTDINGYAETEKKLSNNGLKVKICAKRKDFFEELAVYECKKE